MAKVLAIPYRRGEKALISPQHILFDEENNGRAYLYTADDYSDLLDDLRSGKGITAPIWVKAVDIEGGRGAKLVAGQRRLLAALEYLKENPGYLIPCIWVEPKDEREELILNAQENAGRKDLTIIDQGHIALRLRETPTTSGGLTLDEIAKILRVSQPQVSQALKLVENFPDRVLRAIHQGKVKVTEALDVLKVSDAEQREKLIEEFFRPRDKEPRTLPPPIQPLGQAERPIPTQAEAAPDFSPSPEPPAKERTVRQAARDAGARISLKMPEFRRYLQEAIDEDGPGSNKGEVALKKKILEFLDGKFGAKAMDQRFNEYCKMRL